MTRKKFSCDFETTTKMDDCRVWAYGYMEVGNKKNFDIGNNIDDFMDFCKRTNEDLYFHNLRFDGEFIVNWLLKQGYKHDKTGLPNTFSTIISSMGQWYAIDICYGYTLPNKGKGKPKKRHTRIFDSLKKIPFPVKVIAESFDLPIEKGDIDYHAERPIGHEITEEERKYIINDIEIIADALEIQFKQGLTKMTSGSDSLAGFKAIATSEVFKHLFPVLSLELDKNIRHFYKGGFTWLNDRFAGKELGEGLIFDVNSLYPSQMYYRALPYGIPLFFDGKYEKDEEFPLYMQNIKCEFKLKKGYIPTIQIKNMLMFRENDYLKSSDGEVVELYLTNIDLELFFEHYEVYDLSYEGGWKFQEATGIFDKFIDKWMYIKVSSEDAVKQLAKLMLNSLYGKFATNPDITGKVPYLKEDGSCGYATGEEETKDPIYTPMGAFITSWARYTTISTAQKCFDRIIYCDTDSIHLTGTEIPEAIKDIIDNDKLGFWAHESTFKRGKYIRQKTYVNELYIKEVEKKGKIKKVSCSKEESTGLKLSVKCAGMPDKVKELVTFDNFEVGFKKPGKLMPKHVNGGIVLVDTEFTIK